MQHSSIALWSLSLTLTLASCHGRDRGTAAAGFTGVDSAGFTIATNTVGASGLSPLFTVSAEPRLRIGVEHGAEELQFSRVEGAARLDDGRIAVANGQPLEIRIFSPSGEFLTRAARQGQGPGEIQYLSRLIGGGGDTLLAVNAANFQLLRFTGSSGYIGMVVVPLDSIGSSLTGMRLEEGTTEFLRDGSVVVATVPDTEPHNDGGLFPTGELFRRQTMVVWVSRDRSRSAVLGTFGDIQQMFIDVGGGRRTAQIPPSSRWRREAVGGRGSRFCIAGNEAPEVRCVDVDGHGLIIRWTQDTVPTPPAEIERWRADVRAGAARPRSGMTPQAAERIIAGMRIPPTVPPVRALIVDAEGRVLVSGPDLVAPEGWFRYRVFSRAGELLGIADFPRVVVHEIGSNYVLGVSRNEDGVEFVVVHDIGREQGSRSRSP